MNQTALRTSFINELKASIKLGSPLILTNLAQVALLTTNLILIGRLGKTELAAGSLSASFYHAFMIFSLGLVSATIPMLATTIGKKRSNVREVQQIIRHGFLTAFLVCIPFWFALWHADAVWIALGQNPDTIEHAIQYVRTVQWSLLPYLGYIVIRSFFAALEKPLWTLIIAIAGICTNALFAWLFIFGHWGLPTMGIAGAGLATTLTNLLMFVGMVVLTFKHPLFHRYQIFMNFWQWNTQRLIGMWKLGIPIAITFTLETLVFYAAVLMMGSIGDTSLAAHAIAMQISSVTYMIPLGFGQVATIRVGLAMGRASPKDAVQAGWISYVLGVGFMAIAAGVMWWQPEILIHQFIDASAPENRAVIITAVQFLFFAALFQLADGAQAVAAGMLRGLYDTRTPMLLALLGYWGLGVPIGAFLAFGLDLEGIGIWIGFVAGLSVVAVLLTLRWWRHGQRLLERQEYA
ncbi:MATE family efflux transporter [Paenalcaligenes faecalis]|uniref:MATE family efflux transporter n=1 Tax=Paenalcaligenes faecalis TaxID=2980099 RepID=UPI0022B9C07C|nr:MATE family efflux transporter [Paenalcaligenes faecalis]